MKTECKFCGCEYGTNPAFCEYCATAVEIAQDDDIDDGFYPTPDQIGS